jgi:hypothetical protein
MTPRELIRRVVASPTLMPPGWKVRAYYFNSPARCSYINPTREGVKRCIIGEALHQLGVPDAKIQGGKLKNSDSLLFRKDLHRYFPTKTCLQAFSLLQVWWDSDPYAYPNFAENRLQDFFWQAEAALIRSADDA